MNDIQACQELHSSYENIALSLVSLRNKWESLLEGASDDPKLLEFDQKYMSNLKIDGIELLKAFLELEKSLYDLQAHGVEINV